MASRREVQIKRGDLIFSYAFQSSSNNTAGATIGLWPHAYVHSHALRLWRRDKPWARTFRRSIAHELSRPDDGLFVGGMLGNFFDPRRYIALEIVNPADRPMLLKRITQDYVAIDARLRADLANKESFFAYASRDETDIECMGDVACEYVAAHWGMNAVWDYAAAVFATQSDARSEFEGELARLSADPEYGGTLATRLHGMAQFFLAHDLQSP